MKDIPGIDEHGNPKNGPFKLFFKNGLISCQGEFDNGKKSGKWKYFLNNGTVYGNDTMPMANSGMKVASNRARRRGLGRSMMRLANS